MRWWILVLVIALPLLMGQMCASTELPVDEEALPPSGAGVNLTDGSTVTTKAVIGPGYSFVLPLRFAAQPVVNATGQPALREAYGDGERLVLISRQEPLNGVYAFGATALCIQRSLTSDSGDFLLEVRIKDPSLGREDLAAYGLLATGELLCVEVCSGSVPSEADTQFARALFDSIALDDTDGRGLPSVVAAESPRLRGRTSNGLVILEDLAAWAVRDDATAAQLAEMRTWVQGSPVHIQGANDDMALMVVGRWEAVPVRPLGMVIQTQLAGYDSNARRISFSNGQTQELPYSDLPQSWNNGDDVMILRDRPYDWLVRTSTWQWLRM